MLSHAELGPEQVKNMAASEVRYYLLKISQIQSSSISTDILLPPHLLTPITAYFLLLIDIVQGNMIIMLQL